MTHNAMQSGNKVTHNCKLSNEEDDSSSDENTDLVKTTDRDEESFVTMQAEKNQSIFTNTHQDNTLSVNSCKDITLSYRSKDPLMNKSDCNVELDCELATKYRQHCHHNGFIDLEEHFRDKI
jgi:hypothetical protein